MAGRRLDRKRERFPPWREALARLHNPETKGRFSSPLSPHYRRLAYDELLAQQLAMAQRKPERRKEPRPQGPRPATRRRRSGADLPFAFTGADHWPKSAPTWARASG